ncbi:MAG: DUF5666 domain-containing protein [Anaeromyxobacter sp.]
MTNTFKAIGAVALLALAACGGGATTKTAPQKSGGAIEGTVLGAGGQALTVQVAGGPSTTTDAAGAFALDGVPAGANELRFSGGGVNASLGIAAILAGEYRQVTVSLTGATASERCERTGTEFHGPIEAVDATKNTITVAGRTIAITDATVVRKGDAVAAFGDLAVGQLVEVEGTLQADGTVVAQRVEIRPVPGPGDAPGGVALVGTLSAIDGTNLTVDGQKVDASKARIVSRDRRIAITDLNVGDHVLVRGVPDAAGVILAGVVRLLGGHGMPDDFHVAGKVTAVDAAGGTLTIGDTKVAADAHTEWRGVAGLADVQVGQFADAEVTKQADGTLLASEVHVMPLPPPPPGDLVAFHGTVQAVGADSLTLAVQAGPMGPTTLVKLMVDANTKLMRGTAVIALADVKVGELAGALAKKAADGTLTAVAVELMPAPPPAVLGFHGIVKVVGADSVTLTVDPMMGATTAAAVDVKLLVNADTKILRGATVIGLDGLKVGEPAGAMATKAADGTLTAISILVAPAAPPPAVDHVTGPIGTVDVAGKTVVVGGKTLAVDAATVIMQGMKPIGLADLVTGEAADAVVTQLADGTLLAKFIWVMPPHM